MDTTKPEHPYIEGGAIVSGNARAQDIVPAFVDALLAIAEAKGEHWELAAHIYRQMAEGCGSEIPCHVWDDDQCGWWESDRCEEMIEELIGALHDCAPTGYWFGVNPEKFVVEYGYWANEQQQ